MLEFQALQARFAAHLRAPQSAPAPAGIEERRLGIYRELFFKNIEGALASAFPVLRQLTPEQHWQAMAHDFFARHRCTDPLFRGVAQEFLHYLDNERGSVDGDAPFMAELAHYEWVELALSMAEDAPVCATIDPQGDLLEGAPVVSPLAWTLAYSYPVHRIGPDYQPTEPPTAPTFLIVHRDAEDEVRFIEINAMTARLMERLEAEPRDSGRAHLAAIAAELGGLTDLQAAGHEMLLGLRQRGVLLGTRVA